MNNPQALADHMLYQLDRMMLAHLQSFLREKIGDLFGIYCAAYEAQELRIADEAELRRKRFKETPHEDNRLASRLVEPSQTLAMDVNRKKQQAFDSLCEKPTTKLCAIYVRSTARLWQSVTHRSVPQQQSNGLMCMAPKNMPWR